MHRHLVRLLLLLLCCGAACAQDTGTDRSVIIDRYLQHFVVDDDGSYTLTVENARSIVLPRAVHTQGQYTISYNASLDRLLSVEAWTEKADGRRLPVPPDHIREQQEAASADAPLFQDTRNSVVVFPDVAVGDRLVVRYAIRRHTPLFPGQFEDLSSSQFYAQKRFELTYDMPPAMAVYADAAGFLPVAADDPPGRTRYRFLYVGSDNQRIEADSVSYLDYGKRLAVSTFANYGEFARAFRARLAGKARADDAIRQLAHDITAPLPDARSRALALSDWVRHHIRYVGVYVGPGGVEPHDAPSVLANRYGDCKDHAVLLEALLSAAGIASTPALINDGDTYRLPHTPTLGIFNHMITYVPALRLYLDSTAQSVAAGYLPRAQLGKPVLLVDSGTLSTTPAHQRQHSRTEADIVVRANGSSLFKVARITGGAFAEPFRHAVRNTAPAERNQLVQRMLQGLGQQGSGVFDAGTLDGKGDDYRMAFSGTSENFAPLPGPVGIATSYSFWVGLGDAVAALAQEGPRRQDVICHDIDNQEQVRLRFARGVRIVALPANVRLAAEGFTYRTRYARQGQHVTITRTLQFHHAGPVCSAADYRRMQPALQRILRDLRSQVIVRGS